MASLFTANPFGFLMKMGESEELTSRQSTDSGSMGRKTISDLQVELAFGDCADKMVAMRYGQHFRPCYTLMVVVMANMITL